MYMYYNKHNGETFQLDSTIGSRGCIAVLIYKDQGMNNTDDVINGFNCGFKFQNITYVGICQPIGVLAIWQ